MKIKRFTAFVLLLILTALTVPISVNADIANVGDFILKDSLDNYDADKTEELVGNFKSPTSKSEYIDFEGGKAYQITADGMTLQFMSIVAGFGAGVNPDWSADNPKGIAFRIVTFDKPIGLFPRININETVGTGIDPASGNVMLYDKYGNKADVQEYELETVGIHVPAQFDGYFVISFKDANVTNTEAGSIENIKFTHMISLVLYMCNGNDISQELNETKFIIDDIYCMVDHIAVEASPSPEASANVTNEPAVTPSPQPTPEASVQPSIIASAELSNQLNDKDNSIIWWIFSALLIILAVIVFFIILKHKRSDTSSGLSKEALSNRRRRKKKR